MMETELSDQADAHAMESGFFNKYAIDETDPRKGDPADPKTVIFFFNNKFMSYND